jgi:hypothetical protein
MNNTKNYHRSLNLHGRKSIGTIHQQWTVIRELEFIKQANEIETKEIRISFEMYTNCCHAMLQLHIYNALHHAHTW